MFIHLRECHYGEVKSSDNTTMFCSQVPLSIQNLMWWILICGGFLCEKFHFKFEIKYSMHFSFVMKFCIVDLRPI